VAPTHNRCRLVLASAAVTLHLAVHTRGPPVNLEIRGRSCALTRSKAAEEEKVLTGEVRRKKRSERNGERLPQSSQATHNGACSKIDWG